MAHNMTIPRRGYLYVAKLSSEIPADQTTDPARCPRRGRSALLGRGLLRWPEWDRRTYPGMSAEEVAVPHPFVGRQGRCHQDGPSRKTLEANPKTGKPPWR